MRGHPDAVAQRYCDRGMARLRCVVLAQSRRSGSALRPGVLCRSFAICGLTIGFSMNRVRICMVCLALTAIACGCGGRGGVTKTTQLPAAARPVALEATREQILDRYNSLAHNLQSIECHRRAEAFGRVCLYGCHQRISRSKSIPVGLSSVQYPYDWSSSHCRNHRIRHGQRRA